MWLIFPKKKEALVKKRGKKKDGMSESMASLTLLAALFLMENKGDKRRTMMIFKSCSIA